MDEQSSPKVPPIPEAQSVPPVDPLKPEQPKRAWIWWLVGGIVVLVAAVVVAVVMLLKTDSTGIETQNVNTTPNANTISNTNTNSQNNTNNNSNANANQNTNTSAPTSANRLLEPSALALSLRAANGSGNDVYNVELASGSDAEKVFSNDDVNILDATSGSLFYRGVSTNTGTLFRYDRSTKKSETLVTLPGVDGLWGVTVDPSETSIAYTDRCGYECSDSKEETTTVIKLLDLSTKTEKELSRTSGDTQEFKTTMQWLDANTLILEETREGSEGPLYHAEIYLLDTKTLNITTFALDPNALIYAPALDGSGVVFTTFVYDEKSKASNSSIVLKRFDGTSDVLATSSTMYYDDPRWLSTEKLAVRATTIDTVERQLGYIVNGARELDVITVASRALKVHKQQGSFEELVYGFGDEVYYTDYSKSSEIYTLRRYNLKSSKDDDLSVSGPNAPRFVAATLDSGK